MRILLLAQWALLLLIHYWAKLLQLWPMQLEKVKPIRFLIPVSKCKITVARIASLPYNTYIDLAVENIKNVDRK